MAEHGPGLCVAIDTASDMAGVALMENGALLAEMTWHTHQNHSRQLLPALDWLLKQSERDKHQIEVFCVCLGPGSYAGMRVGISTAKALAFGLGAAIVGVGRLAAEALPLAELAPGRVVTLQAAGRAELALAAYEMRDAELIELAEPHLVPVASLAEELSTGDTICGDIDRLDDATREALAAKGCRLAASPAPRAVSVARLGLRRLQRGERDDADSLVPLYLRAPAIGPQ